MAAVERNPADAAARQVLTQALEFYAARDSDFRRGLGDAVNYMEYHIDQSRISNQSVGGDNHGSIHNRVEDNRVYQSGEYVAGRDLWIDRSRVDVIDRVLTTQVTAGRFAFNAPSEMRQGQVERVTVGIVRAKGLDEELRAEVRGAGVRQLADVKTSPLMSVQLRGDPSFAVTPLSELEQPVGRMEVTIWEFDVRALRWGRHTLTMSAALRLPVAGRDDVRRSVPVSERTIRVRVNPLYVSGHVVGDNWRWFIATGLALVAAGGGVAAWLKVLH